MLGYSQQRVLAIAIAIVLFALGVLQVADADALGLTPRLLAWAGIAASVLGFVAGFLPKVSGADQAPEHIANRVMELTHAERLTLLAELEQRHLAEAPAPPDPLPPIPRYGP